MPPTTKPILYRGPLAQVASVDVDDRHLVAADWKGHVTLWTLGDPRPRWQHATGALRGQATHLARDRVYVTTVGGHVVALARETGALLTRVEGLGTTNGHDALALCGDTLLCFGDGADGRSGRVAGLDADTLATRWTRDENELFRGSTNDSVYVVSRVHTPSAPWTLRELSARDGVVRRSWSAPFWPIALDAARGTLCLGEPTFVEFRPLAALDRPGPRCPARAWTTTPARFSPDGALLAMTAGEGVLFVDVRDASARMSSIRHTKAAGCLRWGPSGDRLYSGGWDRTVREHRRDTGPATVRSAR
ncbi:MAG: PQQ-binding-like beta-propeller repeat protein [Polyangiales bacterium]